MRHWLPWNSLSALPPDKFDLRFELRNLNNPGIYILLVTAIFAASEIMQPPNDLNSDFCSKLELSGLNFPCSFFLCFSGPKCFSELNVPERKRAKCDHWPAGIAAGKNGKKTYEMAKKIKLCSIQWDLNCWQRKWSFLVFSMLFLVLAHQLNLAGAFHTTLNTLHLPCLRLLIATGVVLFHKPSHTSPNCPCPSFLTNLRLDLSISHWSLVLWERPSVTGFSIWNGIKLVATNAIKFLKRCVCMNLNTRFA